MARPRSDGEESPSSNGDDDGGGAPRPTALLVVGAVGVVFGDIGTSPLYAMAAVLREQTSSRERLDPSIVYGMTSTLIWSLVAVVTLLYVRLVLRADNDGEGGLLALFGLLRRSLHSHRAKWLLSGVAMIGAGMFLGDSAITPAISLLSATEGLALADPALEVVVLPLSLVILAGIFVLQRFGTGSIGRFYGPVMVVWFAVLTILGVEGLLREPTALEALSPHWIVVYFVSEPLLAFLSLGSVVLAFTGAEALFADLSHFGRPTIARAWLLVVLPALVISYLGQAAGVVADPATASNPLFGLVPSWGRIPMVALATVATVIASQAVISGAFTVVQQAARLDLLPHVVVRHTSRTHVGQIYLPAVNWVLAVVVLALVVSFRSSDALAAAYGLAVTVTVTVTITMYLTLRRVRDGGTSPGFWAAAGVGVLILVFLAANVPKLASGGWLPVGIALTLFVVMSTWAKGRQHLRERREDTDTSIEEIVADVARSGEVSRVDGSAVFFTRHPEVAPIALTTMVRKNRSLQRRAVLLYLVDEDVPYARDVDRVVVDCLGDHHDGITQVTAHHGFAEHPHWGPVLERAQELAEGDLDDLVLEETLYFVSLPVVKVERSADMQRWRQRLFVAMDRLSPDAVDLLDLPRDRTIVIGRHLTL